MKPIFYKYNEKSKRGTTRVKQNTKIKIKIDPINNKSLVITQINSIAIRKVYSSTGVVNILKYIILNKYLLLIFG